MKHYIRAAIALVVMLALIWIGGMEVKRGIDQAFALFFVLLFSAFAFIASKLEELS